MSFERSSQFHQVRRILRTVAPDFRILANPNLKVGFSAIDFKKKTIEVSESEVVVEEIITSLLFQIGQAIWHKHHLSSSKTLDDFVDESIKTDQFAAEWAVRVLLFFFSIQIDEARKQVDRLVWSREDWVFYFSE